MSIGLLIFGGVVLLVILAVVIFSIRANASAQGKSDDPLQDRLSEFIQRG